MDENKVGNDVVKNVENDGKPFVDAKHLKRRSHLKRHHLPTSEKNIVGKDDEVDMSDEIKDGKV